MGIGGGTGPVQVGGLAGAILGPGGVPGVIGPGGLARVIGPGGLTGALSGVIHGDQASTLVVPGPDGVATTAPIVTTPVVTDLRGSGVVSPVSSGCCDSCCGGGLAGSNGCCGCGSGINGSSCTNCCYPNNFGLGMNSMESQSCCSCGEPGSFNGNTSGCCCDGFCGGPSMNLGLPSASYAYPSGCCGNCCAPSIPYYGQSPTQLIPPQHLNPPASYFTPPIIRPRIPPPMPRPPIVQLPVLPLSVLPPQKPPVVTQPYLPTNDFITNDF
jgi:hypothetical protein